MTMTTGRRGRPGQTLTARVRIVGWMAFLVGLALATSVLMTRTVLLMRIDQQQNAELAREVAKLRRFADTARDPSTGRQFSDASTLMTRYLTENVPEEDETFFTVVDGRPDRRSPYPAPARLDRDSAFITRIAGAREPTAGWTDSPAGRVRYAVVPVRVVGDSHRAALVVLEFQTHERREIDEAINVLALTAFAALVVTGSASWSLAGRVLAPLRMMRRSALRIGESDLTRRLDVSGDDEVAALGRTFNHMLDRLEQAFETQRSFLDDVGHELRTPITVIRGHLELAGDNLEEVAETRALVLDELSRMNRIVDDLLTLARTGRPDFLAIDEVDVADLTVEVVAKARALARRDWRVAHLAEVTMQADGQQVTQALMQLAANAVRHTQDGGLVEVGSAVRNDRVTLWVRDDGPGVPAGDHERIFERFVRRDGPRPPREGEPGGTGLGLAIVRGIAEAHGGTARVESSDGEGARFILEVPVRGPLAREAS
ncbi:HAMP domain-containing sensor histidine kinase [Streptomyces sp. NPDC048479]|uniref:sensor histidine kinase n=1 Tax=Streptomyces sp. NPDC048479 TaxID=3154725 RepID=UPI003415D5C8